MSNEEHQDDIVSAAYKDLANERTPEHLDRQVLAMAAGSAKRPPYSRWIAWARPVAWAATITLCLAITLELAWQPEVPPSVAPNPGATPDTTRTLGITSDSGDIFRRSGQARIAEDTAKTSSLAKDRDRNDLADIKAPETTQPGTDWSAGDTELQQEVADSIADTAAEKASRLRSGAPQPMEEAAPTPGDQPAAAARRQTSNEAEQAAPAVEMLRAEESSVVAGIAMSGDASADSMACPKERRSTARSWYECILELRDAGEPAAAKREQELLVDTFPDFKLP